MSTLMFTADEFQDFFKGYRPSLRTSDEAAYWKFADALIQHHIKQELKIPPGAHVVDAGGGTGRWAIWLNRELGVEVTIADKSESMLEVAQEAITKCGVSGVHLLHCDLEQPGSLPVSSFDGAISTYGVWSFLHAPQIAFENVYSSLRPGSTMLAMAHGWANALTAKLSDPTSSVDEIRRLLNERLVKWASHVPVLRTYSAQEFAQLAEASGFSQARTFGIGVVLHPGSEDFDYTHASISAVSRRLLDQEFWQIALENEIKLADLPELADRGTNLLVVAKKSAEG